MGRIRPGADDPYACIGARFFTNCSGTRTVHGGSIMLPEARAAIQAAATRFVNISELMSLVGPRIAETTATPAVIVTCGSVAALAHATAACATGADPELMLRLPDTRGMRHQVVMPADQRFTYDHAMRGVGVAIVPVADRAALSRALDGVITELVRPIGPAERTPRLVIQWDPGRTALMTWETGFGAVAASRWC